MADEKALVSMAAQFTGLPMADLIGGPLNAAAQANAAMALTQTKFLLDTCFAMEGTAPNIQYKPIMIKMSLTRGIVIPAPEITVPPTPPTINVFETKFDLPILCILPLNSLAVDSVDIKFEMEVKSSYGEELSKSTETKIAGETSFEAKFGYGPFSATVKGSASYESTDMSNFNSHYEKSNSAKYTVGVHAGQLPLPKGVDTIIGAFTNAIEPYEMPAPVAA